MKPSRFIIALAASALLLLPRVALPAVIASAAPSLDFDPSVRGAGMGKSSVAVFWGDDPNYWANPALLGYHEGVRYEWSKVRLAPDLLDHIYFTSSRLTVGWGGLGVSFAGRPVEGLGELKLDYGDIYGRDEFGDPTGPFHAYEQIESWGIGANIVELAESTIRMLGWQMPGLSRFGDVSVGTRRNHVADFWGPGSPAVMADTQFARATTEDRGLVFRLTPYNSIDSPGLSRAVDSFLRPALGGVRVDLSYGESVQNHEDAYFVSPWEERSYIAKEDRHGLAVHFAVGFPGVLNDRLNSAGMGWLADMLTPLVSWGKAWDRTTASMVNSETGGRVTEGEIELSGWELTLGNVFTIRRGRIDEPSDFYYPLHGETTGWGVGFESRFGGLRYDRATVPQEADLGALHPKAFDVWINPLAVVRALRGRARP